MIARGLVPRHSSSLAAEQRIRQAATKSSNGRLFRQAAKPAKTMICLSKNPAMKYGYAWVSTDDQKSGLADCHLEKGGP